MRVLGSEMNRFLISAFLILSLSCFMVKGGKPLKEDILSYRFQRLGGGYSTVSEFDAEIYIIYFFSSYCLTCISDINFFLENRNLLSEKRIIILGVGMDYNKETTLKPFVEYNGIDFPVMVAGNDIINGDWPLGKITTIPTSVLINKREKRFFIHTGNISKDIINQIR